MRVGMEIETNLESSIPMTHSLSGVIAWLDAYVLGVCRDSSHWEKIKREQGKALCETWSVHRVDNSDGFIEWETLGPMAMKPPLTKEEITKLKTKPIKKIEVEIERTNGTTQLRFNIPLELENLYRERSSGVKTSLNWKNLEFYEIPELLANTDYRNRLSSLNLIDDYGQPVFYSSTFNIAWIRTVGGKGSVIVQNSISLAEVQRGVNNAIMFLKEFFMDFIKDFKVKGTITIEA